MKTKKDTRRFTREFVMKCLFQMDFQEEKSWSLMEESLSEIDHPRERDYARRLLESFWQHRERIDQLISEAATGWKLSRMNRVDLALLRLAVTEMLYLEDVPREVSISEAMEISKIYSSGEAHSFINGVLGHVADQLEAPSC